MTNFEKKRDLYKTAYHEQYGYVVLLYHYTDFGVEWWGIGWNGRPSIDVQESTLSEWGL